MVKLCAALAAALLVVGCDASLNGGSSSRDANETTDDDGGGGGKMDADIDAPPACASGRKLFLEFLGVTLTDAAASDATMNRARWLQNTSATVPAFRVGGANRAAEIQQIIDGVKARLSATPIEVVTTRPAAAPYVMIVLGGRNTNRGGTVGTPYYGAVNYHDCGDATKNDVGWVSDMTVAATGLAADSPPAFIADLVVGAVGFGLGLDGTTDGADCMCGWGTICTDNNANACTLSSNIMSAVTNGADNETACQNGTQNEVAAFTTQFCTP